MVLLCTVMGVLVLKIFYVSVVAALVAAAAARPETGAVSKPNIVLLLTDDQDLILDSMQAMPYTQQFMGNGGANFTNFFAHTPVCCPSRGQLLTGRYMHNLKGQNESTPSCMRLDVKSPQAHAAFSERTFAKALHDGGYTTLMAGKFLNGMEVSNCPDPTNASSYVAPPPGWDRYFAMCPDTCYTDCFFSDDGHGKNFSNTSYTKGTNYAPSLIGNVTTTFISAALSAAPATPFFAYVAPHSPHSPATPAPWYAHTFPTAMAPRTAAWNVSSPDHHWAVAVQPVRCCR